MKSPRPRSATRRRGARPSAQEATRREPTELEPAEEPTQAVAAELAPPQPPPAFNLWPSVRRSAEGGEPRAVSQTPTDENAALGFGTKTQWWSRKEWPRWKKQKKQKKLERQQQCWTGSR